MTSLAIFFSLHIYPDVLVLKAVWKPVHSVAGAVITVVTVKMPVLCVLVSISVGFIMIVSVDHKIPMYMYTIYQPGIEYSLSLVTKLLLWR